MGNFRFMLKENTVCRSALLAACLCVLGGMLRGQSPAPTDAGPLLITATPAVEIVHPGDSLKFVVAIKNVSQENQEIEVPNLVWAAATDASSITIPGWPRMGGIGPVVMFRSVVIAPGATFQHAWNAKVSDTAEAGEITLRIGVPLHKLAEDKTWSEPLKLRIVAQEPASTPKN